MIWMQLFFLMFFASVFLMFFAYVFLQVDSCYQRFSIQNVFSEIANNVAAM